MATNFHLFGVTHLAILSAIVLLAVLLAAVQRGFWPGGKGLRMGLGCVILVNTIWWYLLPGLSWPAYVPFPNFLWIFATSRSISP